ncbi:MULTISPECIES: hypothetical protein [Streptomyces]|uniref:Uncharacterized protein n=1 Tax=Streptomyces sudanensis TaxID=436397 RepID=A0ABY4TEA7_9ACTN|nr:MULTISPECIES: hypothetical protein [Streptomyces]MCP9958976.1 hypothetical protein [Streptomyces sudanensis]MCP9988045.1 hypothetical protein [Streptomyces sudanensis]MCQ0000549.1 hypothetical protein [Streptomyces sudanensis]URN16133.1 hypothetical protein MW084_09440 [Streptomyces sudanensis]
MSASTTHTPEITTTECRKCSAHIAGLNGRYACGVCGWVNPWWEGSSDLPAAEDDPDHPGHDRSPA